MKYDGMKASKAARRKAFFEAGGSARSWSGGNKKFIDKKKQASKDACRNGRNVQVWP